MIEKQIEQIKLEDLPLNSFYKFITVDSLGKPQRFQCNLFSDNEDNKSWSSSPTYQLSAGYNCTLPKVNVTVKALGYSKEVPVSEIAKLSNSVTVGTLMSDHPKIWKLYKPHLNKEFIPKLEAGIAEQRDKNKVEIQKLYDELLTIHTELGFKADIRNIEAMDSLLYCEAQGLLMKMEDNINKKSNAKRINLYKALCKLREVTPIECN